MRFCRLMAGSFGLNGSEGQLYKGSGPGEPLTHAFRPGDILGAGIIPAKGCVFFTYAVIPSSHHAAMMLCADLHASRCMEGRTPRGCVAMQEKWQSACLPGRRKPQKRPYPCYKRARVCSASCLYRLVPALSLVVYQL